MNAIILAILSSVLFGAGTAMMKVGMTKSFPKISASQFYRQIIPVLKTLLMNWVWMLGLIFMLVGTGFFGTALGQGDLSVVQPFIALTGVVAALIGVLFLHERLQRIEWIGVATIIAGVVLVGLGSPSVPTSELPGNTPLIIFTVLSLVLTGAAMLLGRVGFSAEFTLATASAIMFGVANPFGKFLTQRAILDVGAPFSFARPDIWLSIVTDYPGYVVVGANLIAGPLMQTALANGRASVVSPLITIISTIIPIIAAVLLFGEQVSTLQVIGIAIVIVGTAFLAAKAQAPAQKPAE